jgi:hypothetical protein
MAAIMADHPVSEKEKAIAAAMANTTDMSTPGPTTPPAALAAEPEPAPEFATPGFDTPAPFVPETGPASFTPTADGMPATAGLGEDVPAAVASARLEIAKWCQDLGMDAAAKVLKFDELPTVVAKMDMRKTVLKYYTEQTDGMRIKVLEQFKALGWLEVWDYGNFCADQCKVPTTPEDWTYSQASRVFEALKSVPAAP